MLNPYAQGGWSNSRNSYSINNDAWGNYPPPQPSLYGALPSSTLPSQPTILTFRFTSLNSVLNCKVIGSNNQTCFTISTLPQAQASTIFYNQQGKNVASVEWHTHPLVEVHGAVPKQYTSRWIGVAPSKKCRTMEVNCKLYAWVSNSAGMNLVTVGPCQPQLIAQVTHEVNSIQLEITAQAVQDGLLESTVVAAAILYCGRSVK
ncbi:hypothetical protein BDZ94DRAFT_1223288 [Collybia nuda]|uniref:DUF6593 domain-containing protein n=1 Tax=Collybia nuda TaxID=64659 RepID=A0A9P5Y101_9AGAR|nr:hypothetical protein BDZ94DRAFT_1223288 [Collybia nuda]